MEVAYITDPSPTCLLVRYKGSYSGHPLLQLVLIVFFTPNSKKRKTGADRGHPFVKMPVTMTLRRPYRENKEKGKRDRLSDLTYSSATDVTYRTSTFGLCSNYQKGEGRGG